MTFLLSHTSDGATIRDLVKAGLIMRTRTDANTIGARNRDYRKTAAAMASGAQAISVDYCPGAPALAREQLKKWGIILVTLDHLPGTYLDGAAMCRADGI